MVGALLGGGFLFLLLTGLHQGLIPIHAQILDTFGLNYLFPILAMGGMGQVGAAAYVYLKTKNSRLKKTISGALPVGIIGVGEPLLFGVSLPLGKPFIAGCIGAGQILPFLPAVVSAWVVGFVAAMILGFTDPQE